MTKEELKDQFKKAIEINKHNFDVEYLNQLDLEIVDIKEEKGGSIRVAYKVHNFNFREIEENEMVTNADGFGIGLYHSIFLDSDLMKKDPEVARLINLAGKEAEAWLKKENEYWFEKIFPFLKTEHYDWGSCHLFWGEQKRILKEKYGIDWQTPQDRHPRARFD